MSQLHKRLSDEQIKAFLQSYCQGKLTRNEVQEVLEIGKTRFFYLLKNYRKNPEKFSVNYQRSSPAKLPPRTEEEIKKALLKEKNIVEDPELPISGITTLLSGIAYKNKTFSFL
jgi:hypothetical protein